MNTILNENIVDSPASIKDGDKLIIGKDYYEKIISRDYLFITSSILLAGTPARIISLMSFSLMVSDQIQIR